MANRLPATLRWWTIRRPRLDVVYPHGATTRLDFPIHSKGGDEVALKAFGGVSALAGAGTRKVRQRTGYHLEVTLRWAYSIPGKVGARDSLLSGQWTRDYTLEVAEAVAEAYDAAIYAGAKLLFYRDIDAAPSEVVEMVVSPAASLTLQEDKGFDKDIGLQLVSAGFWAPALNITGTPWQGAPFV